MRGSMAESLTELGLEPRPDRVPVRNVVVLAQGESVRIRSTSSLDHFEYGLEFQKSAARAKFTKISRSTKTGTTRFIEISLKSILWEGAFYYQPLTARRLVKLDCCQPRRNPSSS